MRRRAAARLRLPSPVLTGDELARVIASPLPWVPLDATWPVSLGVAGLEAASSGWWARRPTRPPRAPTSSCSATAASARGARRSRRCWRVSAVHHSLVRAGLRTRCSLVVDSGEPREVHHVACLVGYGADAVHPWLAGDAIVPALGKGLLKVMSKMGISTVNAYRGAQVFEAIGLGPELIERHFVGTPSKLGGIGLRGLAREVLSATRARTCRPAGSTAGAATASATAGTRTRSPPCSAASGGATSRRPTPPPGTARCAGSWRSAIATRSHWRTSSRRPRS